MSQVAQLLELFRVDKSIRGLRSRLDAAERFLSQQKTQLAELDKQTVSIEQQLKQFRATLANDEGEAAGPLQRWSDLVQRQATSIQLGKALRIYRCPDSWSGSLQDLVASGLADHSGHDPFIEPSLEQADAPQTPALRQRRLVCDALIPVFDPAGHWLEVYCLDDSQSADSAVHRLDSLFVQGASNETCWFYPTEDGQYLSWENPAEIRCNPRHVYEQPLAGPTHDYSPEHLKVLWSLMADDTHLTCVGFTYQRKHIDFSLIASTAGTSSTWRSFVVDSLSSTPLRTTSTATISRR